MSTKVFCIANQKGGVGKTTTAVNLCAGLAKEGVKTLLIDLDPQGNATSALGVEKKEGGSLYLPLVGEGAAEEKVVETGRKNLWMIGSEVDLAALESELPKEDNYLLRLKEVLKPIIDSGKFKAIFIDCPPALGVLSMSSLYASDFLLIALQCEYLALEGLSQILGTIDQLREADENCGLELGGVIMTMFDVRTRLSQQVVHEVKSHLKDKIFKNYIPRSIRLSEAPSFGKTIFEYDPTSSGAVAHASLSTEVIKRFGLKK